MTSYGSISWRNVLWSDSIRYLEGGQRNPRTFVVDIGGFTTGVLLLRGIQPDMQFCRSLEMGAIPMANSIIGRVSALHDIKIDDDHITDVIQGRPTILPGDVQEAIRTTVKSYAAGILDKLRELQVDLRATPAIFTGGGAALFRPFIEASSQVAQAEFVKKSDFIVMAVMDYLQRHPEAAIPGAKIKITCQPLYTKEQLLAMVRDMVKTSVGEFLEETTILPAGNCQPSEPPHSPSEQDIDAMVASLKLFEQ